MTRSGLFLLRATGLTLIIAAVFMVRFYREESWGLAAVPLLLWAVACAVFLGHIGYRSMGMGLRSRGSDVLRIILIGVIQRLVALALTQGAVFVMFGGDWGARSLLATTLLYLVVLGIEFFSLLREMQSGAFNPPQAGEEVKAEQ